MAKWHGWLAVIILWLLVIFGRFFVGESIENLLLAQNIGLAVALAYLILYRQ